MFQGIKGGVLVDQQKEDEKVSKYSYKGKQSTSRSSTLINLLTSTRDGKISKCYTL